MKRALIMLLMALFVCAPALADTIDLPTPGDEAQANTWGSMLIAWLNAQHPEYNVKIYGAQGDGSTDDTTAIQNAIDAAGTDGVVTFGPGTYMATQLVLPAGCKLRGSDIGHTYIKQVAGQTVALITDDTSAANIILENIGFDGNSNTISTALVYLGYGGTQFGAVARMENVFFRNVTGILLQVNANAGVFRNLEFWTATKEGFYLDGNGSLLDTLLFSGCASSSAAALTVDGHYNRFMGLHFEGGSVGPYLEVHANHNGNCIHNLYGYLGGGNTADSFVKLGANCYLTEINSVTGSIISGAGSSVTNGLIHDLTTGTRKIFGNLYSTDNVHWPQYISGARIQLHYTLAAAPATGTHKTGDWFIAGVGETGYPRGMVCTSAGTPGTWKDIVHVATDGLEVRNGAASAGFVEIYEDSDNGTNKVTVSPPAALGSDYAAVNGSLVVDDGANWRVTIVFKAGIAVSITTAASSSAAATWTAD